MKFAMFFFSEYVAVVSSSALMATLFLGGWNLPFLYRDGIHVAIGESILFEQALSHGFVVLIGALAFLLKIIALCWLQLMIRWTLPRFRYDQLMRLGWRKLLPASLVNILLTGLLLLLADTAGAGFQTGLRIAADLSLLTLGLIFLGCFVWLLAFLAKPPEKRRMLASSSAQFAASIGGTKSARMGA
jgi:NADH-quinone oxidoreductase subunit H